MTGLLKKLANIPFYEGQIPETPNEPLKLPTPPNVTKLPIEKIKTAHKSANGQWFSDHNLRFFQSQIFDGWQGPNGVFFVSSEKLTQLGWLFGKIPDECKNDPRKYTVRQFHPKTGEITNASQFNEIPTREEAERLATHFAAGLLAS
jgi:hypothetical protein